MDRDQLIFRMNAVLQAIRGSSSLREMDQLSHDLLLYIGNATLDGQKVRATELALVGRFASPATVYNRLTKLKSAGLITSIDDPSDGRMACLELTSKAWRILNQMSKDLRREVAKL